MGARRADGTMTLFAIRFTARNAGPASRSFKQPEHYAEEIGAVAASSAYVRRSGRVLQHRYCETLFKQTPFEELLFNIA